MYICYNYISNNNRNHCKTHSICLFKNKNIKKQIKANYYILSILYYLEFLTEIIVDDIIIKASKYPTSLFWLDRDG